MNYQSLIFVGFLASACASVPRRAPPAPVAACSRSSALGCYERAPGMEQYPLDYAARVMIPFENHPQKYQGVDILCRERGEPVYAVADGIVDFRGTYMVCVRHETPVGTRRSVYTTLTLTTM